jgi:hypothetical protein
LDIAKRIVEYERTGYQVLEAVTFAGSVTQTHSRSCTFVGVDGRTYWLKATAQQGLVAELVGGRLAALAHAGPESRVVRVTPEALPSAGDCDHLVGIDFGSLDMPNAENARDIGLITAGGKLDPSLIDPVARSKVIAFQTWLGAGDAQVLVRPTDGQVFSFDHGDAFGNTSDRADPQVVVTDIPGVDASVGRRPGDVSVAVLTIEANGRTDRSRGFGHPPGDPWRSPVTRRTEIVEYLIHRRSRIREVMTNWAHT